uniref:Uncharacterized protein n=1 Tax=Rhizophora mucronata TaxID=61149 RepID=A0A2P2PXN4_RHIMU
MSPENTDFSLTYQLKSHETLKYNMKKWGKKPYSISIHKTKKGQKILRTTLIQSRDYCNSSEKMKRRSMLQNSRINPDEP